MVAPRPGKLLLPECDDRIHLHRPARRNETGDQRDADDHQRDERKYRRVCRLHFEKQGRKRASQGEGPGQTECDAGERDPHTLTSYEFEHISAPGSERHPDADLMPALSDPVGHYAVDADRRQDQGDGGKNTEQDQIETRLGRSLGDEPLHLLEVVYRNVFVHAPHGGADGRRQALRLDARAHGITNPLPGPLQVDHIHFCRGRRLQLVRFGIPDHAHNLAHPIVAVTDVDPLADRVSIHEETPREALVDDRHARRLAVIPAAEVAAFEQRNAHRLEIVGAYRAVRGRQLFSGRSGGAAFDLEADSDTCAGKRRADAGADRLNARNGGQAPPDLLVEGRLLLRLRVTRWRQKSLQRQESLRVETGIDLLKPEKALDHQPRACEQHNRERHFRNHKRAAHALTAQTDARRASFFQGFIHRLRGLKRGEESEEEAGQDGKKESETENNTAYAGLFDTVYAVPFDTRHLAGRKTREQAQSNAGEEQPQPAAQQ